MDVKGHLTKTYQYSATGELTYGSATYENEYTYNGESYNPNIQSQYLRARYYSVVTANFLTEDSYLGSINEPLTLNRYNYCISSYPNYEDPSGNYYNEYHPQAEMTEHMYWLTGDEKYIDYAEKLSEQQIEMEYYEASTTAGIVNSVLADIGNTVVLTYDLFALGGNLIHSYFTREFGSGDKERIYNYPFTLISLDAVGNYLDGQASTVWNMDSYRIGRCGGDVLVTAVHIGGLFYGIHNLHMGTKFGSMGSKVSILANGERVIQGGQKILVGSRGTVAALEAAGSALVGILEADALKDFWDNVSRIGREKGSTSDCKTVKELISESDAAKKWGILDDGTNQGVKHFSDYWERYPERIPSLEQRLGIRKGAFNNSLEGFNNFTSEAERVIREAKTVGNVKDVNGKMIYYIDGAVNPKKGVVVIVRDGKLQSMMPSDLKSFIKMH